MINHSNSLLTTVPHFFGTWFPRFPRGSLCGLHLLSRGTPAPATAQRARDSLGRDFEEGGIMVFCGGFMVVLL